MLAGLVLGCDKKPTAPVATPPAATPTPESKSLQSQAKDAAEAGKQAVQDAAVKVKEAGQSAYDQAKPKIQEATTKAKQAAVDANNYVTDKVVQLTSDKPATTDAAPAASFDYQAQVTQAVEYLKENKVDLADKTLAQVESRKASIPESFYPRIASTRTMIDAAKATGGGLPLSKF